MKLRQAHDRDRAQRLSDLVDSFVVQRRDQTEEGGEADRELDDLAAIARELSGMSLLRPRTGFKERLLRELSLRRPLEAYVLPVRISVIRESAARVLRPALIFAVVIAAVWLGPGLGTSSSALALEVLARSDLAVASLLEPGEVLFRRWRITETFQDGPSLPPRQIVRYTLEWIDGSDPRHATGKTFNAAGEMYLAFTSEVVDGRYRPILYYRAGYAGPDDLLSITPTRQEFAEAARRFSGEERQIVEDYLTRGHLYEPILSEHRSNNSILQQLGFAPAIPREVLSVDESATLNGEPVYKVRIGGAVRLPFRWMPNGPPRVWLERMDSVRYIAKRSLLTLKSEETAIVEGGRRRHAVRELVETHRLKRSPSEPSPFVLDVPDGIAVRHQSAYEHLSQVVHAVRRAPRFLAGEGAAR